MQMHVEDYDAGSWKAGEPPFLRRWKAQFLRQVSERHTCCVCKSALSRAHFPLDRPSKAAKLDRKLVCQSCQDKGFTPKDCTPYPCAGRERKRQKTSDAASSSDDEERHFLGHMAFSPDALSKWKRGLLSCLCCKACVKGENCISNPFQDSAKNVVKKPARIMITSKCMKRPARAGTDIFYKCDACALSGRESLFASWMLKNARHLGRKIVCVDCTQKGYSPKDCQTYQCRHWLLPGHYHSRQLKFKKQDLTKYKNRRKKNPRAAGLAYRF